MGCHVFDEFCCLQLMLGDIVISVETAARQAEERGHTLLDEIRILMVCFMIFRLFYALCVRLHYFPSTGMIEFT